MERTYFIQQIERQFSIHAVCALLGPRQAGKSTLARQFSAQYPGQVHYFDLEIPEDVSALQQPLYVLGALEGLVIIDEVQRLPELFPILRVLADRGKARYLILGSASRDLIRQASESLAGRIGFIELPPFTLNEDPQLSQQQLLVRGGFPRSYLADNDDASFIWRSAYVQTFLERDIPQLGFNIPALMLRRFWMMLTHVHGQLLNMHNLGEAMGISGHTVRSYVDILAGTFMVRLLPPWFANISKRQIKTPKLYFRDSGILLNLLGLETHDALMRYPQLGAVWEGFALEQIIQLFHLNPEEAFFWRTHQGAELDLLVFKQGKKIGFEFKFTEKPATTKSMYIAINDLQLDKLYVIYNGHREIILDEKIVACGLLTFINYNSDVRFSTD